jgi:CSLREA domain-containing protein
MTSLLKRIGKANVFRFFCAWKRHLAYISFLSTAIWIVALSLPTSVMGAMMSKAQSNMVVTKTADTNDGVCDGDCSLREAIAVANEALGFDTIIIPTGVYTLVLGQVVIIDSAALQGAGSSSTIIVSDGSDRVLDILSSGVTDINVDISGVTIQGGRAPCGPGCDFRFPGGGIRSSATLTLTNSTITFNVGGSGGGIYSSGTLTVINSTISNNLSDIGGSGGGISSDGPLTIKDSIVSDNTAYAGGGVYASKSMNITDSIISNNRGTGIEGTGGGGITSSASATITNTTISGNSGDGGITYFGFSATDVMTIVNSTISGNIGTIYGSITIRSGGISLRGGIMTISNSTVSGNSTNGYGGGITVEGGTLGLNNVTITDNTADSDLNGLGNGGGLYRLSGGVNFRNSIIAGNFSRNPFAANPDCLGMVNSQGYNLIGDPRGCDFGLDPTTKTDVNPGLGPLQNNGGTTLTHALLANSLAIDAGNPATPGSGGNACEIIDQRGIARPQGSACDIGAYEFVHGGFIYLPLIFKNP